MYLANSSPTYHKKNWTHTPNGIKCLVAVNETEAFETRGKETPFRRIPFRILSKQEVDKRIIQVVVTLTPAVQ
jgi:hypothetical protein